VRYDAGCHGGASHLLSRDTKDAQSFLQLMLCIADSMSSVSITLVIMPHGAGLRNLAPNSLWRQLAG
jgi:hypothetical protein